MIIRKPMFSIDSKEWGEIAISILAITLSLTLATAGLGVKPSQFIFLMAVFAITVGSGFLLHELAHKYFAVKYGAYARYQTWSYGLYLMLGLAIIPQIFGWKMPLFLAPGAVMIYATRGLTLKQGGMISVAGPATNLLLAIVFFILGVLAFGAVMFSDIAEVGEIGQIFATVMLMGVRVNVFLAMFNLLPIPPLDGSKVIAWNWMVWLGMFAISFVGSSLIPF